ncbi:hypothetical protein [Microbacterium sp. ZXX196]|uniref:hypothetical protein n=1 Tax=Microbacterium sp. ZXX196 TaxID=2609291 RepID=UPI0012B6ECA1|nr:hypothetical protein [Microbacterium sp. ZXX196]MTE23974.1 hypothetical protein [Microbacterium sp. ZXX196]
MVTTAAVVGGVPATAAEADDSEALAAVLTAELLGEADYFEQKLGYTGDRAYTVNAINVQVLSAAAEPLVDLSLASSSVRALAYDTAIVVDPDPVDQGGQTTITGSGFEPDETATSSRTTSWSATMAPSRSCKTSGSVSATFEVVAAATAGSGDDGLLATGGDPTGIVLPVAVFMLLAGGTLFAVTRRRKDLVHSE